MAKNSNWVVTKNKNKWQNFRSCKIQTFKNIWKVPRITNVHICASVMLWTHFVYEIFRAMLFCVVERYSSLTRCWYPMSSMLQGRSNFAAVILDGKLVVIGGYDGKTALSSIPVQQTINKTQYNKHNHKQPNILICSKPNLLFPIRYQFR